MGAGIVLAVWLGAAGLGLGVWLAALGAFVIGRRRQSRRLSWLGGVPLVGGTLAIAALAGAALYAWN